MGGELPVTPRTKVRRKAERGNYDRDTAYGILDEAPFCHVAFAVDGQPRVLPTIHARVGDVLYFHGAAGNAMLRSLAAGGEVCVVATLLDGLVVSRSWFHHSMNYRSVVVFGQAARVDDAGEKWAALEAVVEHVLPGRAAESRAPTDAELKATLVVRLPLDEASAKVRTGPPIEEPDDLGLDSWGGVLPVQLTAGAPVADGDVRAGMTVPASVMGWQR